MMKKTIHLLLCIFIINISVVFLASSSFAEEATSSSLLTEQEKEPFSLDVDASPEIPVFDVKKSLIKTSLSLAIILLIIFGLAAFYKKFFSSSLPSQKGKGLLRIIERFTLGPKNQLLLIWVIDRMVLISLNNGTVQKIMEIKGDTVTNEIPQDIFEESLQREISANPIEEVANA